MDDLLGEDWQQPASSKAGPAQPPNFSSFRASPSLPLSGRASPLDLSRPSSTVNGAAKPTSNDSFGGLLSLKSQQASTGNVTLLERQRQLQEEKQRQQQATADLWESLGSGRSTPAIRQPSPAVPADSDDDILAAFNKDAPVNRASHFSPPPPSGGVSGRSTPAISETIALGNGGPVDDDVLGDLGKPLSAMPTPPVPQRKPSPDALALGKTESNSNEEPGDQALAELVDMGFPPDTARIALGETGGDVQSAVGWLLQQAHEESKQKARTEIARTQSPANLSASPQRRPVDGQDVLPAWMRSKDNSRSSSTAGGQRETPGGERDATQVAQELGNKVWKSANTLWKASQKQMAKTIADIQQDHSSADASQPKWMRQSDAEPDQTRRRQPRPAEPTTREEVFTNEAAALDMPREKPQRPSPQPKFMQQAPVQVDRQPANKLSRRAIEHESAEAYVSPARRKKQTPQPQPVPAPKRDEVVDLFDSAPNGHVSRDKPPASIPRSPPSAKTVAVPTPRIPKAPQRVVPSVSPTVLQASATHRKAGGEHFKRGDYAAAHESYTLALNSLPANHPVSIVVLSNRSLTSLKTGDAKLAVSDADRALDIIGTGQGTGETVDLGAGEGTKDMKEFYGKALMRKAEALEHMEKYGDAASVWRQAVEAGVGGRVSLQGRDRCEKAAAPKPPAPKQALPPKTRPPKPLGNSQVRPTLSSAVSAEAVKKLRAANSEASKEEDERFALSDSVDAKLNAWKGGKSDNLRALLQSMDLVLWPDAGWKKVGMSDLVMPARVKIVYMKAIGKVHPDKIPQSATVEQRMISAAVFSTLNEAWDGFKAQNNI